MKSRTLDPDGTPLGIDTVCVRAGSDRSRFTDYFVRMRAWLTTRTLLRSPQLRNAALATPRPSASWIHRSQRLALDQVMPWMPYTACDPVRCHTAPAKPAHHPPMDANEVSRVRSRRLYMTPQEVNQVMRCHAVHGPAKRLCESTVRIVAGSGPGRT